MDNLTKHNKDIARKVKQLSLPEAESRLAEIEKIIKKHYDVGANGQLEPKLRAESIIIIDHINLLK